ncbi:TonB-dependent receptor [Granulicella tundricola]|uniref:TonB-dependent transporter Oar-like beta-barrel domain-containing protein n=1 Tax=Granulicella tundricola (strain ATCC BAA-1859 / DSM 23138 / MP5ACTX9) TaxID=1198114 RepID=E8X3D1_GRATM|nr:TonB-dependent receptor [Granulicella tundricola]ADW70432.1 hypothetical protein AciX9_3426 [Granulicella tundricola MP5ACTX9]
MTLDSFNPQNPRAPRRTRRIHGLFLAVAAVALMITAVASAQLAGKGALRGSVTDSTGAAVPGATIVVTNIATNTKQTLVSTSAGDYEVSLDPGKYTVTVTLAGFKSFVQQNIQVDALQTFGVNAQLQTGDVSETITVTDAPPTLETSNATLGVTLEQEQYSNLPIIQDGGGQRRATDLASLLPGVSANVSNGNLTTNAGIVNGGGSRGATSSIYINGVPITSVAGEGDPRFVWTSLAVDSIDQLQVQTIGYSAIYEGQGVQNYVVKSGSNKLHGVVYDYFRNTALDTWGFLAKYSPNLPATKPVEHQNEYGAFFGFPIIKDKLFVFGGYEGYRYSRLVPQQQETIPTLLQRTGDFTESAANPIYDPNSTQFFAACPTNTKVSCYQRTPFMGVKNGIPTANVIPTGRLSPVALNLEKYLPIPTTGDLANNYVVNYHTGLNNWSTANRIDYHVSERQSISGVIAFGRQSTTAPSAVVVSSGTTTNGLPPPYISTQQFAPKTKVLLFEHDYTFTPKVINQFKYGYGRYDGPGYNQDEGNGFGAAANGITGLPAGQASDSFPTVTFSGNTNINRWAGYSSNRPVASGYVAVDNVQWNLGKHSLTIGGEVAWLQYNYLVNATGVNPLQLTFSNSLTAGYTPSSTTQVTTSGIGYASFMLGAANSASFTQSSVPETGARFRPISPYIQDNWKVNSKLTLDIGLRYDYYPTYKEVKDRFSFLDPNAINPLTGTKGAIAFGGTGVGTCNCHQPVNDYLKNFGPRIGMAFSPDPKTVFRGSYAIIYTHGNDNGGSASSRQGSGLEGFSVTPTTTVVDPTAAQTGTTYYKLDNPYPSYTLPPTLNAGLGTYYTTNSTQSPQTPTYADPYYGGRAPQFINWSFGLQREITSNMALTISYVGSQGHFLQPDSLIARGTASNALDPQYLALNTKLNDKTSTAAGLADLASVGKSLPYATFGGIGNPAVSQALKPFPQYSSVSDSFGFVGNSRYEALQVYLTQRLAHGLTFMTNYTWSRSIDNNGTFRSGYDISAQFASDGKFHAARSLDKSLSLGDQRHKFVITGAYDLPFGKGDLGGGHFITRALFGGYKLSTIFQAFSGAPLSIIQNSCPTNPAIANTNACTPFLNPAYSGNGRKAGTLPFTAANLSKNIYLDSNAFLSAAASPTYMFNTTARTAPYSGLFQPPNYKLDMSIRRSFPIPTGGLHDGTRLTFEADMFNVTNHTHFVYSALNAPLTSFGTSSYGTLTVDTNSPTNRAVQLAARIEF